MFKPLRVEVVARFAAFESFFGAAHGTNHKTVRAQTAKGLAFVQMYAIYEYTVCTAVQTAIDALVSHRLSRKKLVPSLMTLFLDPQLQSLRDSPLKDVWTRRLQLFEQVFSSGVATVPNTVLPTDGSHFRHTQLQLIFDVLGIHRTPAQRQSHLHRVDEVVNHRNAVAHGRETAEAIGGRYSREDVLKINKQMKSVCLLFISAIEVHCADGLRHST